MSNADKKRAEQAEYRAKLYEAELAEVKRSKAYKLSKKAGHLKNEVKADPVGLGKKVAKKILKNPRAVTQLLRSADRSASLAQGSAEQNVKYQEWILLNEPNEDELEMQRIDADNLSYRPLISIVTPVFNPPVDVFEELIESVLNQTYTEFELCLGNFGNDPAVQEVIDRYAAIDGRVKNYIFTKNLGIAGNSNQILEKVNGEFIALLDHDDTLSIDALYENAKLLNETKHDLIYSDKDKIDEKGNRFDPLFKPEYSPEMMLNVNYLTHLNVMRTSLVKSIAGWDPETDGAQDWDLFLRVAEKANSIGFIPKVLYHWRVIATSTAMSIETKPYALANQCKAIDKYLSSKGIDANAYVKKTELFIGWPNDKINQSPLVCIQYSNLSHTQRVMRSVKMVVDSPAFLITINESAGTSSQVISALQQDPSCDVLTYTDEQSYLVQIQSKLRSNSALENVLFIDDRVRLPKHKSWFADLTGWLMIPGVEAASGRLVNRLDLIISSGGIISPSGQYMPIFHNYPRYYQSYIGNAEWVRNLNMITTHLSAVNAQSLRDYKGDARSTFDDFFLDVSLVQKKRIVMTPHVTALVYHDIELDTARTVRLPKSVSRSFYDQFGNPNMSEGNPHKLFEGEALAGIDHTSPAPIDAYQHDAIILSDTYDILQAQIEASQSSSTFKGSPRSVAWVLPSFDGVYAGLMNIFNFAAYLHDAQGIETTFYILKATKDVSDEKRQVVSALPVLKSAKFKAMLPGDENAIGKHDWGIATQWATAYPLVKTKVIGRKFYFIQDNEANFYPKGSISALVEQTYKFGFTAIAGTDGLLNVYKDKYGGNGVVLKSKVDLSDYTPRSDRYYTPKRPYKVFFYARPNMPRNAFELGIAGLKRLKQELGADLEVITAGADWDAASYGVDGLFTNLGKIEYASVPKLYRSVDAGLMFMFSGHPGVTASELMASGCPVVVNQYDDITWNELYVDEETCLTTAPTASEIALNLRRCLEDDLLRRKIIDGGLEKVTLFYADHERSMHDSYTNLTK